MGTAPAQCTEPPSPAPSYKTQAIVLALKPMDPEPVKDDAEPKPAGNDGGDDDDRPPVAKFL